MLTYQDLNIDPAKQKSLALHDELHQLQKQKLDLEEELGSTQLSIPEEIERLTQKVKAANAEVANFDQQRSEVLDHINNIREEISKTEKAMADSKSTAIVYLITNCQATVPKSSVNLLRKIKI